MAKLTLTIRMPRWVKPYLWFVQVRARVTGRPVDLLKVAQTLLRHARQEVR